MSDKVERLKALSTEWSAIFDAKPEHVHRAATLCKCDLATQMVYEFTDLQGHVGRLLADLMGKMLLWVQPLKNTTSPVVPMTICQVPQKVRPWHSSIAWILYRNVSNSVFNPKGPLIRLVSDGLPMVWYHCCFIKIGRCPLVHS